LELPASRAGLITRISYTCTGGTHPPNAALALFFVRQQNLLRESNRIMIITSIVLAVVSSMDEEEAEILMSENLAELEVSRASDRSGTYFIAWTHFF